MTESLTDLGLSEGMFDKPVVAFFFFLPFLESPAVTRDDDILVEFCNDRAISPSCHMTGSRSCRNCCCGPMTHPGRQIRIQAITSGAVIRKCFIRYAPIQVPVRPSPALQWTAKARLGGTASKASSTRCKIRMGGHDPSK